MFASTPDGVLQSPLLSRQNWLRHGFGTRLSQNWPAEYTRVHQIHSNIVAQADAPALPAEADGLVTGRLNQCIGIRTADCVPILLADPGTQSVAAIHAGWKGTAGNISTVAVKILTAEYRVDPRDLIAAIGPCIGECCFQVGPEVLPHFAEWLGDRQRERYLDLAEANRRQLLAAGVKENQIEISGLCTRCDPALFHSYRRDKELSGRMVSAIAIQASGR